MKDFLKSFFTGEKTEDEKAILASQKERDVMTVGAAEEKKKEDSSGGSTCCGKCTCR